MFSSKFFKPFVKLIPNFNITSWNLTKRSQFFFKNVLINFSTYSEIPINFTHKFHEFYKNFTRCPVIINLTFLQKFSIFLRIFSKISGTNAHLWKNQSLLFFDWNKGWKNLSATPLKFDNKFDYVYILMKVKLSGMWRDVLNLKINMLLWILDYNELLGWKRIDPKRIIKTRTRRLRFLLVTLRCCLL